jgi:NADPH2:quinone reductase
VIDGLSQLLAAGLLLHAVGARFRLEDVVAAHEAVEAGAVIGNVIVELI